MSLLAEILMCQNIQNIHIINQTSLTMMKQLITLIYSVKHYKKEDFMKKLLHLSTLCLLVVAFSGCATFGQLETGLGDLSGQNITTLIEVLGIPSSRTSISEDTDVYVWGNQQSGSYITPQTYTTTGNIGNTPYYAQTNTFSTQSYNYQCTIKAIVSNNTATTFEYFGNIGGCDPYIQRLKKYSKSLNK